MFAPGGLADVVVVRLCLLFSWFGFHLVGALAPRHVRSVSLLLKLATSYLSYKPNVVLKNKSEKGASGYIRRR